MKKSLIAISVFAFLIGCTTVPEPYGYANVDDLPARDYAAIFLTDFDGVEQTAAFSAAAGQALGTAKIVPEVPPMLASPITQGLQAGADTQLGDWFDQTVELAQQAFEFDTIVVAAATPAVQTTSIFGITVRRASVIEVRAIAVDVIAGEIIATSAEYTAFRDQAKIPSITTAGNRGMNALLTATYEE